MTSRCLSAWSIVEWCGLTNALLSFNPNLNPANGAAASNPFRLDRSQAVTSDQDHNLVISPWAKQNFVDHTVTDQSSIIQFIEDNWLAGQRIGQGSFDAIASPITQMFNFTKIRTNDVLFLNPSTGERVP
jgi:phospholipase C